MTIDVVACFTGGTWVAIAKTTAWTHLDPEVGVVFPLVVEVRFGFGFDENLVSLA